MNHPLEHIEESNPLDINSNEPQIKRRKIINLKSSKIPSFKLTPFNTNSNEPEIKRRKIIYLHRSKFSNFKEDSFNVEKLDEGCKQERTENLNEISYQDEKRTLEKFDFDSKIQG